MSRRAHAGFVVLALWLGRAAPALAQAAPDHYRGGDYYAAHGTSVAALLAGSLLLSGVTRTQPGADPSWFPGDTSLRGRHDPLAANVSDATLVTTLAMPVAFALDDGIGARFWNRQLVYGETLALNGWLNSVVKVLAQRPRPYVYGAGRANESPRDHYVSFYSGHSSTSFAAATAGAYLFAESSLDPGSRAALWGLEFMLASTTASLRTRAGKHYYSDVLVGAAVGTSFGVLVPLLHGAERRPEPIELGAAALGLGVGLTLSQLMRFDSESLAAWNCAPLASPASVGLQAARAF
ncbi:MAG: phosphatase PAP2 family protein [Polyangiaceae bacterium]